MPRPPSNDPNQEVDPLKRKRTDKQQAAAIKGISYDIVLCGLRGWLLCSEYFRGVRGLWRSRNERHRLLRHFRHVANDRHGFVHILHSDRARLCRRIVYSGLQLSCSVDE